MLLPATQAPLHTALLHRLSGSSALVLHYAPEFCSLLCAYCHPLFHCVQAAAVCLAIRGVAILTNVISATSLVRFIRKKQRAKDKKQNMWERLTRAP